MVSWIFGLAFVSMRQAAGHTVPPAPVRSPSLLFQIILGQVSVQLHGEVCPTYYKEGPDTQAAGVKAVRAV